MTGKDDRQTDQGYQLIAVSDAAGADAVSEDVADEEVVVIDGRDSSVANTAGSDASDDDSNTSDDSDAVIRDGIEAHDVVAGNEGVPVTNSPADNAGLGDVDEPAPLARRVVMVFCVFGFLLISIYVLNWWGVIDLPI
jgi:hypothetical protein